jgi:hypothetical protein
LAQAFPGNPNTKVESLERSSGGSEERYYLLPPADCALCRPSTFVLQVVQ